MWESGTSEPGQAQGRTHEEMKVGVGEMECQETGRLLLWQTDNQPETSNLWAVDKSSEMGPEGGPANPTEHEQPRGIAAERADLGACGCGRASSGSGAGQFLRYQEFDKRGTAVGLSEWVLIGFRRKKGASRRRRRPGIVARPEDAARRRADVGWRVCGEASAKKCGG